MRPKYSLVYKERNRTEIEIELFNGFASRAQLEFTVTKENKEN